MKKIILGTLIVLACISFNAKAEQSTCEVSAVKLALSANSSRECQQLKLEGNYKVKLCSDGQGIVSGSDESVRYLFKNEGSWIARQDLLDFGRNISTTEIFEIDSQISVFTVAKTKTKQNGTVLSSIECSGTFTRNR